MSTLWTMIKDRHTGLLPTLILPIELSSVETLAYPIEINRSMAISSSLGFKFGFNQQVILTQTNCRFSSFSLTGRVRRRDTKNIEQSAIMKTDEQSGGRRGLGCPWAVSISKKKDCVVHVYAVPMLHAHDDILQLIDNTTTEKRPFLWQGCQIIINRNVPQTTCFILIKFTRIFMRGTIWNSQEGLLPHW